MLRKLIWVGAGALFCVPLVAATYAARSLVQAAEVRPPAVQEAEPAPQDAETETELERHMLAIQEDLQALRRTVRQAKQRSESLVLLDRVQAASLACKGLVPLAAGNLSETQRTVFLTAYRREMLTFLRGLFELESAVLDGDLEGAENILKRVIAMEDPSHEQFMQDF